MSLARASLWLLAFLLTLMLSAAIAGLWMLHTEAGARWILARVAGVADGIEFDGASGTLATAIEIDRLRYADESTDIQIDRAGLQIELRRLLQRELYIKTLTVEEIRYRRKPKAQPSAPAEPEQAIDLPLYLAVENANISRLVIHGDADELVQDIHLVARWSGYDVTIDRLTAAVRGITATVSGSARLTVPLAVSAEIDWQTEGDNAFAGRGHLAGKLDQLNVQHELLSPYRISTSGTVAVAEVPTFDLLSTSERIDYAVSDRTLNLSNARVALSGTIDDYRLTWNGDLKLTDIPPAQISGSGTGDTSTLHIDDVELALERGRLSGRGDLGWTPGLRWQLELALEDLDPSLMLPEWPGQFDGTVLFSGRQTDTGIAFDAHDIKLIGELRDRQLALQGRVSGGDEMLRLEGLKLSLDRGTVTGDGTVGWEPKLGWQIDVQVKDIDPAIVAPQWPGALSGSLLFSGSRNAAGPVYDLKNVRIDGQLRQQPIAVRGQVRQGDGLLRLDAVRVTSGGNKLAIDGSFGKRLALQYDVDITELGSFGADFGGSLQGRGRVGGSAQAPEIDIDISGAELRVPGYSLSQLKATGQLAPGGPPSNLVLEASGIVVAKRIVDSLQATVRGSIEQHNVEVRITMPAAKLDASLAGGLRDAQWLGQLLNSELSIAQSAAWRQSAATPLLITAEQTELTRTCWQQDGASACLQGSVGRNELDVDGVLADVPLAQLSSFMPAGIAIAGTAGGEVKIAGTPQAPLLEFFAQAPVIELDYRFTAEDEPVRTSIRDLRLDGSANPDQLTGRLTLADSDGNQLDASAELRDWQAPNPSIQAKLVAALPDTAFLAMLSTEVSNWTGSFNADLSISGDLRKPQFAGYVKLDNASAELRRAGITLEQMQLTAQPAGPNRVAVTGSARSGDGTVEVNGSILLDANAGWPASGSMRGERITAIELPGLQLTVSPSIDIAGNGNELRLSGSVIAPRAIVELRELPAQAVRVSPDVVVVGILEEDTAPKSLLRLYTDLELQLGDEVSFSGFGLRTTLAGRLALRSEPGRPLEGRGVVNLESGKFQAYGQQLQIENGKLLFTGSLEDPTLDVEATRLINDVTVGVRIGGTGLAPESTIFSEPAMAEADALSYLIIGRPLAAASSADGIRIRESAILLGLRQTAALTDQIGRSIGLDELRLDSQSTDTGAIMAGKQVGPDLYVRYSYGLFNRIGALLLRYRLNSRLSLEARSAEDQSIDLIYTRESN